MPDCYRQAGFSEAIDKQEKNGGPPPVPDIAIFEVWFAASRRKARADQRHTLP